MGRHDPKDQSPADRRDRRRDVLVFFGGVASQVPGLWLFRFRGRRRTTPFLLATQRLFLPPTHRVRNRSVLPARPYRNSLVGGPMLYGLSFAPEFFWGTVPIEKMKPSPRPTSVYLAILSLDDEQWKTLARDVFNRNPEDLDVETVLD